MENANSPVLCTSVSGVRTLFKEVCDVCLVLVPHPDLPFISQQSLLLGVVDQGVEERILEREGEGGGREVKKKEG